MILIFAILSFFSFCRGSAPPPLRCLGRARARPPPPLVAPMIIIIIYIFYFCLYEPICTFFILIHLNFSMKTRICFWSSKNIIAQNDKRCLIFLYLVSFLRKIKKIEQWNYNNKPTSKIQNQIQLDFLRSIWLKIKKNKLSFCAFIAITPFSCWPASGISYLFLPENYS